MHAPMHSGDRELKKILIKFEVRARRQGTNVVRGKTHLLSSILEGSMLKVDQDLKGRHTYPVNIRNRIRKNGDQNYNKLSSAEET